MDGRNATRGLVDCTIVTAVPIVLFWAVALWGLVGGGNQRLVYIFFAWLPFGSFAVLPTPLTAGLTFTPTPIVALLIVARCLLLPNGFGGMLTAALSRHNLLFLVLFWIVAVVVTVFMPGILAGRTDIIPFRGEMHGASPLHPSVQNVSQLSYLTISVLVTIAFAYILRPPEMRQHCLRAICLGAVAVVSTGALDFASSYLPVAPLLAPFRTASYALLVSHEVLGVKRIVGLMPEASSYGQLCLSLLSLLYFFRRAIADKWLRDRCAPLLLMLLALFVWLSTSTAAYVGLSLLGLVAIIEWIWRAAGLRRGLPGRLGLSGEFWLACGALSALLLVVIFTPRLLDPFISMFEKMVLQKTSSSSFHERGMWTATSWNALVDSHGIGVGVGSTRASSSVVGVVSSTGFLGALFFYGFVAQTLTRRAKPRDPDGALLLSAVRWSFLPPFAISLMIGISADFGPLLAFLFGFSAAVAFSTARPRRMGTRLVGPTPHDGKLLMQFNRGSTEFDHTT